MKRFIYGIYTMAPIVGLIVSYVAGQAILSLLYLGILAPAWMFIGAFLSIERKKTKRATLRSLSLGCFLAYGLAAIVAYFFPSIAFFVYDPRQGP